MIVFNYIKFTNFKISYKRVRKSHRDPYINIINFRVTQHTNVLSAVLLRTLCKAYRTCCVYSFNVWPAKSPSFYYRHLP